MSKHLRIVLSAINLDLPSLISHIYILLFRHFIGLNPERGTNASQVKVISKTGKLVHKKALTESSCGHPHKKPFGLWVGLCLVMQSQSVVFCNYSRCSCEVTAFCSKTRCSCEVSTVFCKSVFMWNHSTLFCNYIFL